MSDERPPLLVEMMVSWIHPQVMVFLGKVKSPVSDKFERNLHAARTLIDVLAELEVKTEGRLSDPERRLLQTALTELRLNYLDESGKPEPEAGAPKGPVAEASEAPEPTDPA